MIGKSEDSIDIESLAHGDCQFLIDAIIKHQATLTMSMLS